MVPHVVEASNGSQGFRAKDWPLPCLARFVRSIFVNLSNKKGDDQKGQQKRVPHTQDASHY